MHDGTVGIKLLCGVSAVIRKFLDQVFIALSELILRTVCQRESLRTEVLNQFFEKTVRKPILICPCALSKDAGQLIGVRGFNRMECFNNCLSDIFSRVPYIIPMRSLWNNKLVVFFKFKSRLITIVFLQNLIALLVVYIAETFEEKKRKYILLIFSGIDIGTQKNCRSP